MVFVESSPSSLQRYPQIFLRPRRSPFTYGLLVLGDPDLGWGVKEVQARRSSLRHQHTVSPFPQSKRARLPYSPDPATSSLFRSSQHKNTT